MRTFVIAGLVLPTVILASTPVDAEALFDQVRFKPFAARAAGFGLPGPKQPVDSMGLLVPITDEDDPVFQVPGRYAWPVLSPEPRHVPDLAPVDVGATLVNVKAPASSQAPPDKDPGPTIW